MNLFEHVGERIRDLRQGYAGEGLSQAALAKMLGVAPNTVSRWETGNYKPTLEDLDKLARTLSVSILEFFPKDAHAAAGGQRLGALLRAAEKLPDEDVEELRRYAEFRRARVMYAGGKKPKAGRKRKSVK